MSWYTEGAAARCPSTTSVPTEAPPWAEMLTRLWEWACVEWHLPSVALQPDMLPSDLYWADPAPRGIGSARAILAAWLNRHGHVSYLRLGLYEHRNHVALQVMANRRRSTDFRVVGLERIASTL